MNDHVLTGEELDEHIVMTMATMPEFIDALLGTPEGRASVKYTRTRYAECDNNSLGHGYLRCIPHWYTGAEASLETAPETVENQFRDYPGHSTKVDQGTSETLHQTLPEVDHEKFRGKLDGRS